MAWRNLKKIAVVSNAEVFELLYEYGEDLLRHFGYIDGTPELRTLLTASSMKRSKQCWNWRSNLHEIMLDRAIAWTYLESHLELAPSVPLLHGHAEYRHGTNSYYCGKPRLYHG